MRSLQTQLFAVLLHLVAWHGRDPEAWSSHMELGTANTPPVPRRLRESFDDLLPADTVCERESAFGRGGNRGGHVQPWPRFRVPSIGHEAPEIAEAVERLRRLGARYVELERMHGLKRVRDPLVHPELPLPLV